RTLLRRRSSLFVWSVVCRLSSMTTDGRQRQGITSMGDNLGRLRELWEKTSRTNQAMLIAAVVAALIVGIGFAYWAGTPDYVTLVSNPSPQDAAGIIAQLQQKKILYRISPDGSTIEVPASQRAELRMSLASAGLLNTGSL